MKHKVFSFINILGLSVGISACFLIFLYVSLETSFDKFHSKADRIYRVISDVKTPTETIESSLITTPVAINLKLDFPEIEDAVRIAPDELLVKRGNARFQEKEIVLADSTLFNVFDFPLIAGNKNTALIEPMSVVLSQTAAKKYFGDSDAMGQLLQVGGESQNVKVTGIMKDIPRNSQIKADMIFSQSSSKNISGFAMSDSEWTNHTNYTYILVKPHTNAAALAAKFDAFQEFHHGAQAKQLQMQDYLSLEPLKWVYLHSRRGGMVSGSISNVYIFSAIGIFVLLIACVNFINLTTARSAERAKEVGIRKVAGALRFELARQFITESVIICIIAYFGALLLSMIALPLFNELAGKEISDSIFSNPLQLLEWLGLAIFIGLIAGFYPALVLSSFKPISVLKGRFSAGTSGLLLRQGLVVFQFTISSVLITATLIVYRQLEYMRNQNLGFNKDQTIIVDTKYDKNKDAFKHSLSQIPGVLSSTYSSHVPGGGYNSAYTSVENSKGEMQKSNIDLIFVDFDYVKQYDLKLAAGRSFSKDFSTDSTQAMMINEAASKMLGYATPVEAIGRRFNQWGREGQIIGVLKDFHYKSLQKRVAPLVMRFEPWAMGMISVKVSAGNLHATVEAIRDKWRQLIPGRPFDYSFLNEFFDRQYRAEEHFGNLFFHFAMLAIFISCLGLLGLSSYSTMQRTKEIGIRKVLGANVGSIVNLLSIDFIKLVLIALVVAAPVVWFTMNKWLEEFEYRAPITWWIFGLAGLLSAMIAFSTISFQAIRAALANPVRSLRAE